jgi:CheY-like chemotaxis protein
MITEKRKHVLIVDDEEVIVAVLRRYVTMAGYDQETAMNGREALERVAANPPDLILLDLMMPEMNGFEACRQIRSNPATAKIPVIVLTALRSQSDSQEARNCGATEFIVKPVTGEELVKRLKHYLGSPFKV